MSSCHVIFLLQPYHSLLCICVSLIGKQDLHYIWSTPNYLYITKTITNMGVWISISINVSFFTVYVVKFLSLYVLS